jgi:hypothetical protein
MTWGGEESETISPKVHRPISLGSAFTVNLNSLNSNSLNRTLHKGAKFATQRTSTAIVESATVLLAADRKGSDVVTLLRNDCGSVPTEVRDKIV